MVEEGQNQALKRIRVEEEEDEDGISKLPDCLLVEILSVLPSTKDAIRTGTLSKRWKHLWTAVPNLIFLHPPYETHFYVSPGFFSFVDKTLTQRRQLKLHKFRINSRYNHQLEYHIHNWIRYAVICNVQQLNLTLWNSECKAKFPLDDFVFTDSCFTHLTLSGCIFNPTGAIRWKNLRKLCISKGNLNEDLIENILSGSPVLETLVLNYCYGFRRLNIASKSVKNLVLAGYSRADFPYDRSKIVEINAPNILTLKIQNCVMLRKLLLLNVSSLVEAHLDCKMLSGLFERNPEQDEEETLKEFILKLRHVKDLKIGSSCVKVLARLEAKGFISPWNLNVLDVTSSPNGPAGNELQEQLDAITSSSREDDARVFVCWL